MTDADLRRLEKLYIYPAYADYFNVSVHDITDHESYTDDDDQLLDWSGYDKMIRRSGSSITHVAQRVRTKMDNYGIDAIDMSIRTSVASGRKTELQKMQDLVDDPTLSAPSVYFLFRSAATSTAGAVSRGLHDAWVLDYRRLAEVAVGDAVDPTYQASTGPGNRADYYDLETLEEAGVVQERISPIRFERIRKESLAGAQTSLVQY